MNSEPKKIACLLITHLGIKDEIRRHPELADRDLILYTQSDSRVSRISSVRPVVFDVSKSVNDVPVGMPLAVATRRYPDSVVIQANVSSYGKVFAEIVSKLEKIVPAVQVEGLGKAYMDISRISRISHTKMINSAGVNDAEISSRILRYVPNYLQPRLGIAHGKFPSYLAAASTNSGGATRVVAQKNGDDITRITSDFVSSFSIDHLPIEWKIIAALHRFGIHNMSDLASYDLGILQARFGAKISRVWQLAKGIDIDRVPIGKKRDDVYEYISLPFASSSKEVLLTAIDSILHKAYRRPELKGRYASEFLLECSIFNAPVWSKNIVLKEPAGTSSRASFSIRSIFSAWDLPGPIEDVAMSISRFSGESGIQLRAFTDSREDSQTISEMFVRIDRQMQSKMNGINSLYRIVEIDSVHPLPEMRAVKVAVDSSSSSSVLPTNMPEEIKVFESNGIPISIAVPSRNKAIGMTSIPTSVRPVDMWKIDLWWMPVPVKRVYYVLQTDALSLITVFKDLSEDICESSPVNVSGSRWYRQNY